MKTAEQMKNAWIDQDRQIISFQQINGAVIYTARETDFWKQILSWMRSGYRVQ